MGYRQLLKKYIAHVDALVGNDLIEVAALTNAMNKRDLGELRTLAAELQRDSFANDATNEYHTIIRSMVSNGSVSLEDLGRIKGIEAGDADEVIPEEKFRRIVKTLADSSIE